MRELVRLGAPGELAELAARGVSRTCGVEFLRRTAELTLDGARDLWEALSQAASMEAILACMMK